MGTPNSLKTVAGTPALQITHPARKANLVEERDVETTGTRDWSKEPTYRAAVRVYAVDGHLLVVDRDRMAEHEIAELVMVAISDTDTIFRAANASVQVKGHGYMVTLPPAEDAGFRDGDTAPVIPAPNMLVIVHGKREAHNETSELADALHTIRNEQYSQ